MIELPPSLELEITDAQRALAHERERAAQTHAMLAAVASAAHALLVTDSWESAVTPILESIGAATHASRAHLLLTRDLPGGPDGEVYRHFEWTQDGVPSAHAALLGATAASTGSEEHLRRLASGEVLKLLRSSTGPMQPYFEATATLSSLVVPVLDGDVPHAMLCLEDIARERAWDEGEEEAMRNLAAILGGRMRRQCVETTLRHQEERYRRLLDAIPYGVTQVDKSGCHTYVNRAMARLAGRDASALVGTYVWDRAASDEERDRARTSFLRTVREASEATGTFVTKERAPDGKSVDLQIDWAFDLGPEGDVVGLASVVTDITERLAQCAALERSLAEKSVLLREVHHRVKNNLQIVASLLRLSDPSSPDEALHAAEHRIGSIALVHDILTRGEDLSHVDLRQYLHALVESLRDCVGAPGQDIAIEHECEPLELALDAAVPVGLILNEAITNAIEHAFPGGRGIVHVEAHETDDEGIVLSVTDDGCGLPSSVDAARPQTLGLQLVRELSHQIGGRVSIQSARGEGTRVELRLPARASA